MKRSSLCFTALPELFESMAPQFCAYFYGVALGIVEPISAVHFIEKLWDSRWFLSDALRTSTSLFAWIWLIFMGQHTVKK